MTHSSRQDAAGDTLASVENVSLTIRGRSILESISLAVHPGEIVTLIGPNGAGKTTLVRVLLGLTRPDSGTVHRRPGLTVGYVPQRLNIDPTLPMSVRRFLQLGGRYSVAELRERLEEVGGGGLLDQPMSGLSGGELQRVLLARAILRRPDLLVLDEPVQGVDVRGQRELYEMIAELRERYGCAVLMISHDLHLVMAATDRVFCLSGHVCCSGQPEAVSRHPEYLKLFGTGAAGLAVYTHHHDHEHDRAGEVVRRPRED